MGALGRRKSTFKQVALNTGGGGRRLTKALIDVNEDKDSSIAKPKMRLENTYKMKPDDDKTFSSWKVKVEVESILHDNLKDVKYDSKQCANLCRDLSQMIRNRIKDLGFVRYRIISNVIIGQCLEQGLEFASRCVWDDKVDNHASVTYKNHSIFAIALIHGVFFEWQKFV